MPHQVLVVGPDHLRHPRNRKAKCYVRLRALQDETGLTDAALQHIALVCGPRNACTPSLYKHDWPLTVASQ